MTITPNRFALSHMMRALGLDWIDDLEGTALMIYKEVNGLPSEFPLGYDGIELLDNPNGIEPIANIQFDASLIANYNAAYESLTNAVRYAGVFTKWEQSDLGKPNPVDVDQFKTTVTTLAKTIAEITENPAISRLYADEHEWAMQTLKNLDDRFKRAEMAFNHGFGLGRGLILKHIT